MHCIYNYIPETGHVSRVHSIAAVLYLQFVLHVLLSSSSSSSVSPLCRVSTLIFLRQTMSLGNTVLQLFMVLISLVPALTPLYLYVSTFRSMCAVPSMAVFCSFLTSWFPGMLLTYFLNDFEMVPFAPIITGITFVSTLHYYYYYCYYYFEKLCGMQFDWLLAILVTDKFLSKNCA